MCLTNAEKCAIMKEITGMMFSRGGPEPLFEPMTSVFCTDDVGFF